MQLGGLIMKSHKVKQGDCFSSITKQYGFHDPEVIYSDPANSSLKAKRKNMHLLKKGDVVKIPDKVPKKETCPCDAKSKFKAKGFITQLKIIVEDFSGNAFSGMDYTLDLEGTIYEGKTTSAGLVEQKIDAQAMQGTITIWLDNKKKNLIKWPLKIGSLDPHDDNAGVQARLNNLGYSCGKVDGRIDKQTKQTLKVFKANNGLADDDVLDDTTKNKIEAVYGF